VRPPLYVVGAPGVPALRSPFVLAKGDDRTGGDPLPEGLPCFELRIDRKLPEAFGPLSTPPELVDERAAQPNPSLRLAESVCGAAGSPLRARTLASPPFGTVAEKEEILRVRSHHFN